MRRFSSVKFSIVLIAVLLSACFIVKAGQTRQQKTGFENDGEKSNQFACSVNCMDGRIQDAIKNYMQKNYKVDYVDMVTEPGPNKILADNPLSGSEQIIVKNIKKRIFISAHHHGAKVVAIVGHFGCSGNPNNKEEQIKHLKEAQKTVESFNLEVRIVLLWVEKDFKTVQKID